MPGAILSGLQHQVPYLLCLWGWHRACHPPGPPSTKLSLVSLVWWQGEGGSGVYPQQRQQNCFLCYPRGRTWEASFEGAFGIKEQGQKG